MLLAALDSFCKQLLSQHAQVAFKLSLSRHSLRLDYRAETVEEYARVMLAEFETLSLASEPSQAKRQRIRKLKEGDEALNPKAGAKFQVAHAMDELLGLPIWGQMQVCPSSDENALKGRCFFCSSESHWANAWPVKAARRAEARKLPVPYPVVKRERPKQRGSSLLRVPRLGRSRL